MTSPSALAWKRPGRLRNAPRPESQSQIEKDSSKGKHDIRSILCPKPKFVHNCFSPSGLYKFTDKHLFRVNYCVIHYCVTHYAVWSRSCFYNSTVEGCLSLGRSMHKDIQHAPVLRVASVATLTSWRTSLVLRVGNNDWITAIITERLVRVLNNKPVCRLWDTFVVLHVWNNDRITAIITERLVTVLKNKPTCRLWGRRGQFSSGRCARCGIWGCQSWTCTQPPFPCCKDGVQTWSVCRLQWGLPEEHRPLRSTHLTTRDRLSNKQLYAVSKMK